ncbi:hypothetical protein COB11_07770 [Candidatus Aerophobetes bacterium]|uniref:Uncharacterized protein n=1 Tax=Aerophobetes bacterium TaxID=2030807 RepID=A0A2A4YBR2_UNCAE|nr:MAG: hypothetical protein COB11_07770 [Candidatus Aerophobetes bacterium]
MDISKYTAFFHDGSVMDIQHTEDKIVFFMASAEMDEDDIKDDINLSKDNSIQGKLHIEGIKRVTVDDELLEKPLRKEYDNGHIFDFEITKNSIELSIDWINFPPKPQINEFSVINVDAKKIYWENIPNLEDSY